MNKEFNAAGRQEKEEMLQSKIVNYKKEIVLLHDKNIKLIAQIDELEQNIRFLLGAIVIILLVSIGILIGTI